MLKEPTHVFVGRGHKHIPYGSEVIHLSSPSSGKSKIRYGTVEAVVAKVCIKRIDRKYLLGKKQIFREYFFHKNPDDYLFGYNSTHNIMREIAGLSGTRSSSKDAVDVIRKMLEDIFFDVLNKCDYVAYTISNSKVHDVHVNILCDSSVIGYPHVVENYLYGLGKITKTTSMGSRPLYTIYERNFFSSTQMFRVMRESSVEHKLTHGAIDVLNGFLTRCMVYYISNIDFIHHVTNRNIINREVAIAARVLTGFPDDTGLKRLKSEKVKTKIHKSYQPLDPATLRKKKNIMIRNRELRRL